VSPDALPSTWRDRAGELERYAPAAAAAFWTAAGELEEALQTRADEPLTLDEAAAESGYSKRRLRELVAEGTIANAGRRGAPRIRRADLPMRPGATSTLSAPAGYDVDHDAAELAGLVR